ncbi:V-type ATPase 116kDa subunit family protein [bacterium]|nr:V-type ATPase 116kDa subunit family protein [bacterium]
MVAASEQRIANGHEPADAAALREEVADLRQRLADVQSVLEENQQHITRAQNYQPHSDRGEAVSPLLRALERVALTIQDIERKGGQKG